MVNRHTSLSPRNSGFIPLKGHGPGSDMGDTIQLTTVKSHGSTGARKPFAGNSSSFDSSHNEKEKVEIHHRHAGRRRKLAEEGVSRTGTGGSDEAKLNAMGKMYNKIINASVITRYLVYVVPVGILLAVPLVVLPITGHRHDIHLGTVPDDKKTKTNHGPALFDLFLWIEISWLTLWAGKVVAWALPKAFIFFCGIVSSGTRKYATVLANMSIPFSLFFWALASWLTFKNLFKESNSLEIGWVQNVERVLGAFFASSCVLLAEKAVVQLIGVSYHQRSFANRIKDSKREIHILGLLYDASRTLFPMYCREFEEEDYVINDSIEMILRGKRRYRGKNGSATPMRLIGDVGRLGDKVTSVFGNIASEITGKQVFNPNSAHSIVVEALEKTRSSEAMGRRIWMSFVVEGRDVLLLEDVQEVLGPAYKDEAEEAFNAIDNDMNGDISLDEMIRKVVEIGKERKAISEGMKDIGQALRVFDSVLLFIVLLIVIFIFLLFFKSSFVTIVATAGTALLSLSFIFAVTTQEFLGSCIFLFVKHPYDVGDRVEITGTQLVVERISLLYSVFTRVDTMKVVQIPNIVLNGLWIDNISRSKAMHEGIQLDVSYDTSFEDIELLRMEMEKFVRSADNARDFYPSFAISVGSVGNLDKLTLFTSIKHKSNWHNDAIRGARRSKFMCALAMALKKVPIYGPGGGGDALGGPSNPTYSVSVNDDFASKKREESSKKKEASRMVPTQTAGNEAEIEKQAVAGLNARDPVPETSGNWDTQQHDLSQQRSWDNGDDSQRSRDIDTMRQDLLKRQSTHGRRKAGEGLPSLTETDSGPRASLSQTTSPRSQRFESFDEEAQTGMPSAYYNVNRSPSMPGATYPVAVSSSGNIQRSVPHPLQSTPVQPGRSQGEVYAQGQNYTQRPPQGPPPGQR